MSSVLEAKIRTHTSQQIPKTNEQALIRVLGENEDGVQRQDMRDKRKLKSKMKTSQR